ncbi:MAG: hypothetical protein RR825_03705 [Ruthenibacterium sp.]
MGLLGLHLLTKTIKAVPIAITAGSAAYQGRQFKKRVNEVFHPRKDVIIMKKSTLLAILVTFSAIAGALAAAFVYLRRREAELDEYEQLLFSDDFSHEEPEEAPEAEPAAPAVQAAPAVKATAKPAAKKTAPEKAAE